MVVRTGIGCLPFAGLGTLDLAVRLGGGVFGISGTALFFLLLPLYAAAGFWAVHFLVGTPRMDLASICLGMGLIWLVLRTDWVVRVEYDYSDSRGWASFSPPVGPLWQLPRPEHSLESATSWRDLGPFAPTNSGGPVEEPHLSVKWWIMGIKLTLVTVVGYWFLRLCILMSRALQTFTALGAGLIIG